MAHHQSVISFPTFCWVVTVFPHSARNVYSLHFPVVHYLIFFFPVVLPAGFSFFLSLSFSLLFIRSVCVCVYRRLDEGLCLRACPSVARVSGAEGLKQRQRRCLARSLPLASRHCTPTTCTLYLGSAENFLDRFLPSSSSPPPFLLKPIASPHWFVRCSFSPPSHSSCPLSRYYTPSSLKTLVMELYIKVLCVDTVGSSILIIIIPVKNPAHLQGKVPALGPAQLQSTCFGRNAQRLVIAWFLFIFFFLSSSSLNFHPPSTSTTDN
jgi:hypothetical protein